MNSDEHYNASVARLEDLVVPRVGRAIQIPNPPGVAPEGRL